LIAHVFAIFLLPVLEKSAIFNDFRAIAHSISAHECGNTVYWKALARKRTGDESVTYWFPWKHLMARRRALEFGVLIRRHQKWARQLGPTVLAAQSTFLHKTTTAKASDWPFGPRHSPLSPTVRNQPKYGLALRTSRFERRKCTTLQFFAVSMSASRSRTCCARLRPR